MGIRTPVARSTLAEANENHDWRMFADFTQALIASARPLHVADPFGVELDQTLYALDATTIDLCLSLFSWARFRQGKAAVKVHTLLDLRGSIPAFLYISDRKVHEVNVLDSIVPEAWAVYVMDRGYLDFDRLYRFTVESAFFVLRNKSNVVLRRRYSHTVDRGTGLISDQTVVLDSKCSASHYPDPFRRVSYRDPETGQRLVFLTNNFALPALTIAAIYKSRWKVELFFKWIKQHLRIKGLLRNQGERCEVSNLDRRLGLCPRGNRPEAPRHQVIPLQLSTGPESHAFRKNAHFTGLRRYRLRNRYK